MKGAAIGALFYVLPIRTLWRVKVRPPTDHSERSATEEGGREVPTVAERLIQQELSGAVASTATADRPYIQ
jgi:hypothetical protein